MSVFRKTSERLSNGIRSSNVSLNPLNSALPDKGICRILVCRVTHSLGNTLLLTPLIQELQTIYPGSEIDIVTRSKIAREIFGQLSGVRNIFIVPAHGTWHPIKILQVLRRIRANTYDLIVDPYPRSRTGRALLRFAAGRYKLGFLSSRRIAGITHGTAVPKNISHVGQQPVHLVRAALCQPSSSSFPPLDIALSASERDRGRRDLQRLKESGASCDAHTIGIFAHATGTKLIPTTWWNAFASAVSAIDSNVAFVEIVPEFGRSLLNSRFPTFFSSDIRRLASVISGLSHFISADCGIMHLACATGVPVAGVFSVTNPAEWGPYGQRDFVVDMGKQSPAEVAEKIVARCRHQFIEAA